MSRSDETSKKLTFGREGNPERARLVRIGSTLVLVVVALSTLSGSVEGGVREALLAIAGVTLVIVIGLLIKAMRLPHKPG